MKNTTRHQAPRLFLPAFFWLVLSVFATAQTALDSLENRLITSFGKDKLMILNELIPLYLEQDKTKEALRHARTAEIMAEAIITPENRLISAEAYYLKPLTFVQLGKAYQEEGRYLDSQKAYEKALVEAESLGLANLSEDARNALEGLTTLSQESGKQKKGFLGKAFRDISTTVSKTTDDFGIMANLKLAKMHENNEQYDKAVKKYELVINQLRDQGDWEQVQELQAHLAELQEAQGNLTAAVSMLSEIKNEKEKVHDNTGATIVQRRIDEVSLRLQEPRAAQVHPTRPQLPDIPEITIAEKDLKDMRWIAERAENNRDYEASLNYYKQYLAMEQALAEQEKMQELTLLEKAHQIESQEQELALLRQNDEISQLQLAKSEVELKRQLAAKRTMTGGLALSGMLVLSLFMMYRNKRRDHQKLGVAYNDLEVAQNQLKDAQQRIKGLLNQQLSGAVANELLTTAGAGPVQRKFVCVMFLDIRDFTPYVEQLSPEEIIEYQNKVLGFMMETINKHKGVVNQIMGDGFMATFGAPISTGNDCREAYLAAEEIKQMVREKSASGEIPPTRIGIGLHAGQVVAGNVGTKDRKQYSITGNPVIIASRLEQLNKEFSSTMIMSKEVYDHLPEELREPLVFNPVQVKGRTEPVEVAVLA